ncbi:unnamed protein product [Phytophthora lilii]|uniref:Unnamed protein product n=1 Tax=Phytophthora lilii TaxID=2077276 RepID=A0A9W6TA62_9STRA|nr:unnamed protein product [Phytophthora lilii]
MVDAEAQTEPPVPQDALLGVRVRKSFGARAFWGTVAGCYWVAGGLFYKVSFDDGDVDILSADEVLQDAQQAKKHQRDNPQAQQARAPAADAYLAAMRQHRLKRKREDAARSLPPNVRQVQLWGQRLYASIFTNDKNETFIQDMPRTEDGDVGEMEATGQVQVGDMILAVNNTRALGLPSNDLAELIRKPKRPITLTLYRPQRLQQAQQEEPTATPTTAQTQENSSTHVQPPTATQSPTPTSQVQQPAQPVQPPAPASTHAPIPQSFLVRPPVFSHATSTAQALARQWTQQPNTSVPQQQTALSTKEIIRQRVVQNATVLAAARQSGYTAGYPLAPGSVAPTSTQNASAARSAAYSSYPDQYIQRIVSLASTRVQVPASTRPNYQHQTSASARRIPRTGPLYGQHAQQVQATRQSSDHTRPRAPLATSASSNGVRSSGSIPSQNELVRRPVSSQPPSASQNVASNSQPNSTGESTSDRSSADSAPRGIPPAHSSIRSLTSFPEGMFRASSAASMLNSLGVVAIADLAKTDPPAAKRAMHAATSRTSFMTPSGASSEKDTTAAASEVSQSTSFLSPSGISAEKNAAAKEPVAESASHSMSFLSPNDFNVESSTPSRASANSTIESAEVQSNVSLVSVMIFRRRLYLTLGLQGTLIAVTSFVPDEKGNPGEVEASGKVFLGDILVRINSTLISSGMTPTHVASIVNSTSRPMTLWFERASWDALTGRE